MKNWINKIVEVDGVKYLVSRDKISVNDLITNGRVVKRYDDTHSLLGYDKVIATENDIAFVKLTSNTRSFEMEENEIEYIPFTKRWMDAILHRNGVCNIVDIIDNKLVLDF